MNLDEGIEVWEGTTTAFYNLARLKNRRKTNSQRKHMWDKDKQVQAGHWNFCWNSKKGIKTSQKQPIPCNLSWGFKTILALLLEGCLVSSLQRPDVSSSFKELEESPGWCLQFCIWNNLNLCCWQLGDCYRAVSTQLHKIITDTSRNTRQQRNTSFLKGGSTKNHVHKNKWVLNLYFSGCT